MPPSVIPPSQLQAMMRDLRAETDYVEAPEAQQQPAPASRPQATSYRRRPSAVAFGWVMVGAVLGIGVGYFAPGLQRLSQPPQPAPAVQPTAMVMAPVSSPPAPVARDPAAVAPHPAVVAPPAAIAPAPRIAEPPKARPVARIKKAAAAKPTTCARGGACTRRDVQLAERRLRTAYDSARRAGVSGLVLSDYRRRWERASRAASSKPRTTVGAYRNLAGQLNGKAAQVRARRHR